jgi:glyoxylase-like metal-dependent hydrolase (beta-lactamase superfamily II)
MNFDAVMNLPSGIHFFERGWLSANNTLLLDHEQAILIDTGYHSHASQTLALIQSTLGQRSLTHILNTHLHSDHCGGNALLQEAFPDALILTPPGLAPSIRNWDPIALTYTPTGQTCPQFRFNDVLRDGQDFEVSGRPWKVHAAPGHDPHSVVLFCPAERILISADALWENGFGVVFPEIEGDDAFHEVANTLNLIEKLQPALILPGHGAPFRDLYGALTRARSKLAKYVNAPGQHAVYAAKVLLKFKLLEFQTIAFDEFVTWAGSASYLHLLHQRYASELTFADWIHDLCNGMQRSGACMLQENTISNA